MNSFFVDKKIIKYQRKNNDGNYKNYFSFF